jgi:hypothetical protein
LQEKAQYGGQDRQAGGGVEKNRLEGTRAQGGEGRRKDEYVNIISRERRAVLHSKAA